MRTATPWWLALAHLFGLGILFVAQRTIPNEDVALVSTIAGLALVVGATGARVFAVIRTNDSRRRVERTQLLASIGTVVALVLYYLGTKSGMELVGQSGHKWSTAMLVLCAAVMAASVIPMVMVEATLGIARRDGFDLAAKGDDDAVEYRRVREVSVSGLTIALALGFLMATCSVAQQRNITKDTKYRKTTAAGESTAAILNNTSEPISVELFFPAVNEVKDEARAYFQDLADQTGKVTINERSLMVERKLAEQYKVTKEGVIVLVRGEGEAMKSEKIELDLDYDIASRPTKTTNADKPTLRNLDGAVNAKLMRLVREKRKAYLTVGHGEINDPDSLPVTVRGKYPDARAKVVKERDLGGNNYEVKDLGRMDLVGGKVPDDATMVLILGPKTPFEEDELTALDAYIAGGGNVLVALDPKSEAGVTLGPLEARLGVHFDPTPILDTENYVKRQGPTWVLTNQFSSHASITSAAKKASNEGVLLLDPGSLVEVPFAAAGADAPKRTFVIHTMPKAFRDLDGNGALTDGTEKGERLPVVAAIEGPKRGEDNGFRAMVFADVDLFIDRQAPQGGGIVYLDTFGGDIPGDAIKWIGGEEVFSGVVENENDVEIEPSKRQDSWWFLLTIVGAPLLVLGAGLAGTMRRRRPVTRKPPSPESKKEDAP